MKRHKGRVSNVPLINPVNNNNSNNISIFSIESGRISANHIKSLKLSLKWALPNNCLIIPKIYATMSVTKKPSEVRMGKGKGSIAFYIARVRQNAEILQIRNLPIGTSLTKLYSAILKLPIRCTIISRN